MSDTPGEVKYPGRRLGQDNRKVYCELLDLDDARLHELSTAGVI